MDDAMRLLTLQIFSHLYALLGITILYALDDDKLSEWKAANQLQFAAAAFRSVLVLLSDELL